MGCKKTFEFDQVVGIAGAVGIEADEGRFESIESIEAVEGFVHADFAGEANAGVFAGEVWSVKKMNAECAVAIFAGPEFGFGDGAAVLFEDFRRGGFAGIDDDDDFDGAFRAIAAPEGMKGGKEFGLVEAGNDDDHPEVRVGRFGDQWGKLRGEAEAIEVVGCGGR